VESALASLIVNQASFEVVDAIAADLADKLMPFQIEVVVGLPTLGLTLASAVAQKLGHGRYVPLGVSRKFWYREDLSVPLSSITTPDQQKRLYLDPRMLPLLEQRRLALVDDVISSGASIATGIQLLASCGVQPEVLGVPMLQSDRWRECLRMIDPHWLGELSAHLKPLFYREHPTDAGAAAQRPSAHRAEPHQGPDRGRSASAESKLVDRPRANRAERRALDRRGL
jgi:adenine/guanine phosphoribosyltransferase-like PRPP-binding protein